ncbi:MAG TPA: ZIP family metal transporter [Longimicrobium sp.]|nr:ZIP family metal transporter [Longimicrobium sp.]
MTDFVSWFRGMDPRLQALFAGLLTLGVTSLGAGVVVFARRPPGQRWMVGMLGFASGIMLAASFWSLLDPAIRMVEADGKPGWFPAAVGFLLGALFLRAADAAIPHMRPFLEDEKPEGVRTGWKRPTLLVLAITMHNIPEGLAVGVAFGAAAIPELAAHGASFAVAAALAVGIALQNFPEGLAVAMPLRAAGASRRRAFVGGTISAAVEPLAAVLGAAAVLAVRPLLPYTLAFAAGAMIYVVVDELIPESQQGGHGDTATFATMIGFAVMMVLDTALG